MKKECNIIQDLLPNYIENLVSKDTAEYIENHIKGCDECKEKLELMKNNKTDSNNKKEKEEKIEVDHLKKYKKKMKVIKSVVMILIVVLIIGLMIGLKVAVTYNTYNIIAKNVVNSRQDLENLNNYSIYKIWGYEDKETGEMIVKSIQEYYYKDGKYKIVDKLITNDNLNIEKALKSSDGVIIDKIEYGSDNSDDKVRVIPKNKTIENITTSYEKTHFIKNLVYSYALGETLSADDKDWKVNFAMNFLSNNIEEKNFLGTDCYVIKENGNERWYNKANYRPVRIITDQTEEYKEVIFFYHENNVTDEDVEFNQEEKENNTTSTNSGYSLPYNSEDYKDLPINYNSASYAYDTSSPEKAIGVADYAFVAKVNGILRTEYRNPSQVVREGENITVYDPYTVYSISVIENIKGEIVKEKDIELIQHGGLSSDKSSYEFMDNMKLLNIGEYYIFLPYTASDGRLGISNSTSIVSLGTSAQKNNRTSTINEYKKAAENPIIPEGKQQIKSTIYDTVAENYSSP